jgi:hydrogenase nickel incorporation protein HypB
LSETRTIQIHQSVLARNDRQAERNRGYFRAKGWLVVNVLSAPGAGKTSLLQRTIAQLAPRCRCAVIVGDLATDNDALRLRQTGAPVVQITTGSVCHLEADMVARALTRLPPGELDLLFIENVGNLVCPAAFDLGEDLRAAVLSVTEGEDKPLKYPPLFQSADVVLLNKMDLADAVDFDRAAALDHLRKVAPGARVCEVSARTGQGLAAWCELLIAQRARAATSAP